MPLITLLTDFGTSAKKGRFAKEDRRGHRSTHRGLTHRMRPSIADSEREALVTQRPHEVGLIDRRRTRRTPAEVPADPTLVPSNGRG